VVFQSFSTGVSGLRIALPLNRPTIAQNSNDKFFAFKMNTEKVQRSLGRLTPQGQKWFRSAVDPFHDYQLDLAGYPDTCASNTVVIMHIDTTDVSYPVASVGNWDCQIVNLPRSGSGTGNASATAITAGVVNYQSTPPQALLMGAVTISSADTGQALWPNAAIAAWTPTNFATQTLTAGPAGLVGHQCRIIGQAIEVHNITSPLYRQGSVTIGKIPQVSKFDSMMLVDDDAALVDGRYPVYEFTQPPSLLTELIQYPNCVAHEAEKGVYSVISLNNTINPLEAAVSRLTCAYRNNRRSAGNGTLTIPGAAGVVTSDVVPAHTDSTCIYFTGLSHETTLRITVKTIAEYAPIYTDALLQTATPSPPYDPRALQLYAEVIRSLPPGVPVDFNGIGRWFRMVLQAISAAAPIIGAGLNAIVPGAGVIGVSAGQIAGTVANIIKQREDAKDNNKKKKRPSVRKAAERQFTTTAKFTKLGIP
jgi:hypothetical protein